MSVENLPETVRYEKLPPDAEGTADFMSRIGYSLEEALADIIDNSIDAGATTVLIRFISARDRVAQVVIADDGKGMSEKELHVAMQYGVRQKHQNSDLGKYGIGLKAASFSQCKSLTVLSRKSSETAGRRWTIESIKDDWRLEILDASGARRYLDMKWEPVEIDKSGTLVIWNNLDTLQTAIKDFTKNLEKTVVGLTRDLGVRFHRFLENGSLKIYVDVASGYDTTAWSQLSVAPLNPFGYTKTGRKGYPAIFKTEVNGVALDLVGHIWPAKSDSDNYKLGGGKVAGHQGFYFYRNDRLIKAGGWHNYRNDTEPHSSLARVLVEMPPELDSVFRLTVQKNDFNVPPEFIDAVKNSRSGNTLFDEYIHTAEDVYRTAPKERQVFLLPGKGLSSKLGRRLKKEIKENAKATFKKVDFIWQNLGEDKIFEISDSGEVILNKLYRDEITGGYNTAADAPLVKVLLMLLLEDVLLSERISAKAKERISQINIYLLEAI